MTDSSTSENSACTNHLRTCVIEDPEDIRIFEENMRNPKVTEEQRAFFKRAIDLHRRTK